MNNVGLSITEGVANGASALKSPSKRNIGLLGQFSRGVALTPTKITSLEEFNVIFGGQNSSFYGPGMVRSIFKEAGDAPVTLYLSRVVGTGAVVATATGTLTGATDITVKITAGYRGNEDAGTWANGISVTLSAFGEQVRGMYTLTIVKGTSKETYNYATLSQIQVAVNKTSKYILIEFSGEDSAHNAQLSTFTLAGGVDGTVEEKDFYADSANKTGLSSFEGQDVQIIAVTEFHTMTMAKKLNEFLEEWGSPIGVCNLPIGSDENTAELYADELQTPQRSFLASYLGWAKVPDDDGNAQLLPVIAPVLGAAYIRTPYVQGDYIHIPPGGLDSVFHYVTEVQGSHLKQSVIDLCVQQLSCNIIQYVEGIGYYVGSSRTYSTNDMYCSMHIRQQTSYYVRSLLQMMRFMEQKPNTPELKKMALADLYRYFKNEYEVGALERSVDFDEAYQGICDGSNNPRTQDRKLINIDILWIPTECAESIHISLQRNDGVLTAMEA